MSNNSIRTLVVIDPAIKDFHVLVKRISEGIIPQAEAIILQPNRKEVEQITCAIQKFIQISDIHIISQASPGCLYLGNSCLSVHNFNYYRAQLKNWSVSNIFLYGTNLGAEEIGKKFILRLYKATGANISTLFSTWGIDTQVGIGIWNTIKYTSIKPELVALTT